MNPTKTYPAGTYTVTGPAYSYGRRTGSESSSRFPLGSTVTLREDRPADADGDLYVTNTETGRSGYIVATSLTQEPAFPVGSKVVVAAEAKTANGSGVYFGGEVVGEVVRVPSGSLKNYMVKATAVADAGATRAGQEISQLVGPDHLSAYVAPKASDFAVGDLVTVAADAKTESGSGVYFGTACEAKVIAGGYGGDVHVEATDGTTTEYGSKTQYVGPAYLTKREAPAEEPEVVEDSAEETPGVETIAVAAIRKTFELYASGAGTDAVEVETFLRVARAIEEGI